MAGRARPFDGQTAIVTGAASGIGRALAAELVAQGARVVLADIDGEGAVRAADRIAAAGGAAAQVEGRRVDVRDFDAVRELVDQTAARDGAIDLLFNNAGLSIGGPTHEMTLAHWDRIIDVNLRGVVNGILAAYPRMVEQGRGHIVNTASAAGLVAPPWVVPYAATKHAVVGLSTGLRPEAALHGVRVSVLCPGAVETPILDSLPPDDLPATASAPVTARAYLKRVRQKPVAADRFARAALRDVVRDKGVIVLPRSTKPLWYLHRLSPALVERITRSMARTVYRDLIRPRGDHRAT
jgi:NAD(P)-dependent dehydrogenase (short-subunit alcohol dehydrogenase family)